MSLQSEIDYDLYLLKQMVRVAEEALENRWSYEGMDPKYRATSPGDIFEWHMSQIPDLMEKVRGNLKKLGGKNG